MTGVRDADAVEARLLLRAARQGALATVLDGQPHAALVTPATAADGDVLLLLSGLSAHTRALAASPGCALLVQGTPADVNPQTAPRVTLHGEAERLGGEARDAALRRFLAIHPYAALYAGFGDFGLFRIRPRSGLFVGGFGRARKLPGEALRPPPDAVAGVGAEAVALLAEAGPDAVAIDPDGVDRLVADGRTVRVPFETPAADAGAVRAALARLAAPARLA